MKNLRIRFIIGIGLLALLSYTASAQWVQTNGPEGGYVWALAKIGTNLFAGTGNGVYRSTDSGNTWTPAISGLGGREVWSLASKGTILFAGTQGGLFRSNDSGNTWSSSGLLGSIVYAATVCGTKLFAVRGTGSVALSTDSGVSWTAIDSGLPGYGGLWALAVHGDSVFVGSDSGVFFLTPNGTRWTFSGLANTRVWALAVNDSGVFAGTDTGGVFRSTDNGASWSAVNTGLTNRRVHALAVNDSGVFAGTGTDVFHSTDNGSSWNALNTGIAIYSLLADGSTIYAGTTSKGVFRSTDNGASWRAVVSGIRSATVFAMLMKGNSLFAGAAGVGLFLSNDNGNTWTVIDSGLTGILSLGESGGCLFAGMNGKGIFRSIDNGATWRDASTGLVLGATVWAFATLGTTVFAGTINGIFRSTDSGTHWSAANTGLPANTRILSLVVHGNNLFAGTFGYGVFLSTDSGTSWTAINSGLTGMIVYALAANDSCVFAGTGYGVFRTTDSGVNWSAVNTGLTNHYVNSLACIGTNLLAGTSFGGVFLSKNNGNTWTEVNSGMAEMAVVFSLVFDSTNLFAGTQGNSVWRLPLQTIAVKQSPNLLPEQFSFKLIKRNYANPNLVIAFSLSRPEQVTVKIYNLSGHEIATLVNKKLGPGPQKLLWDTRTLATGCYAVRMQAGSNAYVKSIPVFR